LKTLREALAQRFSVVQRLSGSIFRGKRRQPGHLRARKLQLRPTAGLAGTVIGGSIGYVVGAEATYFTLTNNFEYLNNEIFFPAINSAFQP